MKYFNETYKKREFLRRNEWADTYRATHAVTDEHVTLKVLAKKSNDEEYINNLLKEVETIKTIKNPNLIHVNNMFKYSGFGKTYYYIEGEYFKGDSLKEVIENSKIDIKESVKIVERAAEGIKEFHDKNILFNSLNLENILMNSREIIKVDVLSYLEHKTFQVKEDESLEENKFNPQKDIYALGAVLYCLLSGNQIFNKNKYKKDIKDDILIKIIDRATNPQCESRYINIDRMIMDLKSYLKTGDIKSDNYDYNDEISNKNKKQKKQKNKKEKAEKKTKKDKTEAKKAQATNKKEDKDKKGKLGKTFAVCTTVALLAGATVYGYEYLEKNGFELNKITASDENDKVESNKELKEENKVEETKKEESKKEEQTNKKEENKTATSKKEENNKKTETTTSSNNSKKDKNTSGSNNSSNKNNSTSSDDSTDKDNTSSNINKPNSNTSKPDSNTNKPDSNTSKPDSDTNKPDSNTSKPNNNTTKPNNNSSKPNNNQSSGNTTKPEEGSNDSGSGNTNQTPAVTPDTGNSTENNTGEVEATPENELATE